VRLVSAAQPGIFVDQSIQQLPALVDIVATAD
jgi:hypothetical protein